MPFCRLATVHEGKCPDSRVVKLHRGNGRESALTKAFLQSVSSERGKAIVTETGFTP